jgi:hypothetical protein
MKSNLAKLFAFASIEIIFYKRHYIDITWLESGKSFLQVKASMTMKEKLLPVQGAISVTKGR